MTGNARDIVKRQHSALRPDIILPPGAARLYHIMTGNARDIVKRQHSALRPDIILPPGAARLYHTSAENASYSSVRFISRAIPPATAAEIRMKSALRQPVTRPVRPHAAAITEADSVPPSVWRKVLHARRIQLFLRGFPVCSGNISEAPHFLFFSIFYDKSGSVVNRFFAQRVYFPQVRPN